MLVARKTNKTTTSKRPHRTGRTWNDGGIEHIRTFTILDHDPRRVTETEASTAERLRFARASSEYGFEFDHGTVECGSNVMTETECEGGDGRKTFARGRGYAAWMSATGSPTCSTHYCLCTLPFTFIIIVVVWNLIQYRTYRCTESAEWRRCMSIGPAVDTFRKVRVEVHKRE